MAHWHRIWSFETAHFTIRCEVTPEDMDPADSFELPEDIKAVRNGEVEWFCARVTVDCNGVRLAADYLSGCAYRTFDEFITGHRDPDPENRNTLAMKASGRVIAHYFPDMVRQAIAEARDTLATMPHLRTAA